MLVSGSRALYIEHSSNSFYYTAWQDPSCINLRVCECVRACLHACGRTCECVRTCVRACVRACDCAPRKIYVYNKIQNFHIDRQVAEIVFSMSDGYSEVELTESVRMTESWHVWRYYILLTYYYVSGLRVITSGGVLAAAGEANVLELFVVTDGKRKVPVAGCRCVKGCLDKRKLFKLVRRGETIVEGRQASRADHRSHQPAGLRGVYSSYPLGLRNKIVSI